MLLEIRKSVFDVEPAITSDIDYVTSTRVANGLRILAPTKEVILKSSNSYYIKFIPLSSEEINVIKIIDEIELCAEIGNEDNFFGMFGIIKRIYNSEFACQCAELYRAYVSHMEYLKILDLKLKVIRER